MSSITFVTSILHIYDTEYDDKKTIEWRIDRFLELVELGIKICIYVSPEMEPLIRPIEAKYPDTIKIMRVLRCEDTMIARMIEENCPEYRLPTNRNIGKDQAKYSIVINSKTEFMTDTVRQNPWNSTHFAWIDFNITYVFRNKENTLEFIRWMANQTYIQPECFAIAGCEPWYAYRNQEITDLTESIYWRFCGGFFLGDASSIQRFHQLYLNYFPWFLREYHTLVWEVNFWAWLEVNTDWKITWYPADHDDRIVCSIPAEFFTPSLVTLGSEQTKYDYPWIENQYEAPYYFASSASYLRTLDGRDLLNTRYVNYWHDERGQYQFFRDPPNYIRNLNFCSELNDAMIPKHFIKMEETIDLPYHEFYSRGIEDVRLYEYRSRIRYIATTVSYYHTQGNRMIVGDYIVGHAESQTGYHYENSRIVESPEGNHLEKNWAPLIVDNPESPFHGRELFVYKWSPFTIGELRENPEDPTGHLQLNFVEKYDTSQVPFFHKMKGSTQFVDTGEYLVGVVHFTEDASPRKYFHMLVTLDHTTMRPLRYSNPFCFEKVSIEFCIGFRVEEGQYVFWISRMDRDPLMVRIEMDKIPLCGEFLW